MTSISRIYSEKPVSQRVNDALNEMCEELVAALSKGKAAGIPQGLLVAIVAGHFHEETQRMLSMRDHLNDIEG